MSESVLTKPEEKATFLTGQVKYGEKKTGKQKLFY